LNQLAGLIRYKVLLTWRLYTRHTLASLETILFLLAYSSVVIVGVIIYRIVTARALVFVIPELLFADLLTLTLVFSLLYSLVGHYINEGYDLNRLRIWPLSLNTIFAANIGSALMGLNIVMPVAVLSSMIIAAGCTFPQYLASLIFIFGYTLFMVVAGQTIAIFIYVMLPKLNFTRLALLAMGGVLVWSIIMGLGGFRHPASWFNFFIFFRPPGLEAFRPYPGGQIGIILTAILNNDWSSIWIHSTDYRDWSVKSYPLLGFLAWTAVVFVLDYLLHAAWMDSDIKGRAVVRNVGKVDPATFVLKILRRFFEPLIGPTAFELYRKDMLEYAFRSHYFLIYKIFPGSIAPIIIALAMKWNIDPQSGLLTGKWHDIGLYMTVILILFIVLGQAILFAGNQFGFEDANIKRLMSFPTPRRNFMLGKNLFFSMLFFLDALILAGLALIFFPGAWTFFATLTLGFTIFLLILSLGNFTSAIWPYWMPLDKPSFTLRTTVILGFVNMGITVALVFSFLIPFALVVVPHLTGVDWLSYILMPLALAYAVMFHKLTMKPAVAIFEMNEFLILRRVADKEQL